MPYPNEHACRIRDPSNFKKDSFRRITQGGLSVIIGRLKGKTTTTTQAFRYPKDSWTADRARTHCKENDGSFEPASESSSTKREDLQVMPEDVEAITPKVFPTGKEEKKEPTRIEIIEKKPLETISLFEIELLHAHYHSCGELFSDCCKKHFRVANEMLDRGYTHFYRSACDEVVELIRNYKTFNPKNVSNNVLRDDWRIVSAWIKTVVKEGKKFTSPQFKDLTLEEQKKVIRDLRDKIKREMERRGWKSTLSIEELPGWDITPKQIRYRLRDVPKGYRCGLKEIQSGVSMLFCTIGNKPSKAYSIRFNKATWTLDRAKKWLKKHRSKLSE